jgi:molybdenum cofactor guanylyltransferase
MRLLGAILAGGQSRRFGSDKAEALFEGRPLLDHVADALRPQCEELLVVGRDWPGMACTNDQPKIGLGPLGGLAAALNWAQSEYWDGVLSCGCDIVGLPDDLAKQLGNGPAIYSDMPIIGLWPAKLFTPLVDWLAQPSNRSVYRFADHVGARRVATPASIINVNLASDLAKAAKPD